LIPVIRVLIDAADIPSLTRPNDPSLQPRFCEVPEAQDGLVAVPIELNGSRRDVLEVGAFLYEINEWAHFASRGSEVCVPVKERGCKSLIVF
jgi:hypothetical protein